MTIFIQHLFMKVPKIPTKRSKEDEQTLAELNSAHHRLQAKYQLEQNCYITQITLVLFPI